jgi:putative FmdB family regulatory protein
MPIHEYSCDDCQEVFEQLIWRASEEEDLSCPKCGHKKVKRLISRSSIGGSGRPGVTPSPSCGPFR